MDKARKRAQKAKKRQQAKASASQTPKDPNAALKESLELLRGGKDAKAVALLKSTLERHPEVPQLYGNLILALERVGKPEEALRVAEAAVENHPKFSESHNNLGAMHKFAGRLDTARDNFRKAVELAPGEGEVWRNLTSVTTYTDPADPDIAAMRKLAERLKIKVDAPPAVFFALGKALEDVAEYDESFLWYSKANRQMRGRVKYKQGNFTELVDTVIETLDESFFGKPAPPNASQEAPIFVVGMPRSGSTLIEQILASHPNVEGGGEVPELGATLTSLSNSTTGRVRAVATLSDTETARLGRVYLDRIKKRHGDVPHVVDKFLLNFLHLGFVHRALPNAKIIYSRRDALDTCFACFKVMFTSNLPFTYSLDDLADFQSQLVRLMAHWDKHMGAQILTVDYESVVADQEAQTRRMLEFCGLDWHPDCLRFFESKRRVQSASSTQVRRPIYKSSIAKWKHYESHLESLIEALR